MNYEAMKTIGKLRDIYKQQSSAGVVSNSLSLHGSAQIQTTSGQEAIGLFGKA